LGIKQAKNDNIIITCPEVLPVTPVLEQFATERGNNIQGQSFAENGEVYSSSTVHNEHPGSPTLAMFNRKDILAVNGWDESFVAGYAWEDTDFGTRLKRAGVPFKFRDDIQSVHVEHPHTNRNWEGYCVNQRLFEANYSNGIIKPKNGIVKL
jgi:GT2 family glycosyltransferase